MSRLAHFESLFTQSPDPWQVHTRWYEQRKLALVMAALPRARYAAAFEPACGTGALTARLAERCDAVLASDFAPHAVDIARRNTQGLAHVRIERQELPRDWPAGGSRFDLVVISEWGYYVSPDALDTVARHCVASLRPGGTLLACHYRPDFDDQQQPTAAVHAALGASPRLVRAVRHEEAEFLLDVWTLGETPGP